ncbi:hypothetical protein NC653_041964 [Populus alba x Populus x berolinensis]|uniref:Uncharacterized protein n=1 Tax=Populus alba x Populus x berolinensis TaxID=444605 RepID=A0AAD6L9T3_9ROSI|nr:hypothetical protein NC653_041964 [Populus alba x Populus x berolinensis]
MKQYTHISWQKHFSNYLVLSWQASQLKLRCGSRTWLVPQKKSLCMAIKWPTLLQLALGNLM